MVPKMAWINEENIFDIYLIHLFVMPLLEMSLHWIPDSAKK